MADRILTRHATPFTASLFFISAVSGVALFFHAAPGLFHEMHVWLSLVLLLPVAFHIWRNWHSLMTYIRRRTIYIPLADQPRRRRRDGGRELLRRTRRRPGRPRHGAGGEPAAHHRSLPRRHHRPTTSRSASPPPASR